MALTLITSEGNSTNSLFDKRFGRASYFCIFNENTNEVTFIENKYATATTSAGLKTIELLRDKQIDKVISGDFGKKVYELLQKEKIQMVMIQKEDVLIKDLIHLIKRR